MAGSGPGPRLAVTQVQAAFRADRPPRHQQPLPVRPRDRVRVDDPQVDPCHAFRAGGQPAGVGRDGNLGGHVGLQPPPVEQQRHRPDLPSRVGHVPVQPHHQRQAALRDRQAQHPAVQRERPRVPADRHHPPAPPREPRRQIPALAAPGGGEPCVTVAAQHRPGTRGIQLAEGTRAGSGQFPAQLLVGGQRPVLPAPPPPVQLQHAAPHITRRPQQPEQTPPLPPRHPQPAPRRPVHHGCRPGSTLPAHAPIISTTHRQTTERHLQHPTRKPVTPPPRNKLCHPLSRTAGPGAVADPGAGTDSGAAGAIHLEEASPGACPLLPATPPGHGRPCGPHTRHDTNTPPAPDSRGKIPNLPKCSLIAIERFSTGQPVRVADLIPEPGTDCKEPGGAHPAARTRSGTGCAPVRPVRRPAPPLPPRRPGAGR